jgi:hypothetical protein
MPRKSNKKIARPRRPLRVPLKPRGTPNARRVAQAVKRLNAAHRAAFERGESLLALADQIGAAAETRLLDRIVGEARDRSLLRDIAALDAVLRSSTTTLPPTISPFRLLPTALIEWLRDRFGLVTDRDPGEELDVNAARIDQFDVSGDLPKSGLVRVRITDSGWKRNGRIVVPPCAVVVSVGMKNLAPS